MGLEEILTLVAQYGFPIVIAIMLLQILANKLEKLVDAIIKLNEETRNNFSELQKAINENTKVLYMIKAYLEVNRRRE